MRGLVLGMALWAFLTPNVDAKRKRVRGAGGGKGKRSDNDFEESMFFGGGTGKGGKGGKGGLFKGGFSKRKKGKGIKGEFDCDEDTGICTTEGSTFPSSATRSGPWFFANVARNDNILFTSDQSSTGSGSLFIDALSDTEAKDQVLASLKVKNKDVSDFESLSYDYYVKSGDATFFSVRLVAFPEVSDDEFDDEEEEEERRKLRRDFYTDMQTQEFTSDFEITAAYEPSFLRKGKRGDVCIFDFSPSESSGSLGQWLTFEVTGSTTKDTSSPTLPGGSGDFECPETLSALPEGSVLKSLVLSVGDNTTDDAGVSGYLDNVVVTSVEDGTTTYDFEPVLYTVEGSTTASKKQNARPWTIYNPSRTENILFSTSQSSVGEGSLFVEPLSGEEKDYAVASFSLGRFTGQKKKKWGKGSDTSTSDEDEDEPDLLSISYDYYVNGVDASSEQYFFMSLYAFSPESTDSGTTTSSRRRRRTQRGIKRGGKKKNLSTCRFDYVPSAGTFQTWETMFVDESSLADIVEALQDDFECPQTFGEMPDDTIFSKITINIGNETTTDADVSGYLDNVIITFSEGFLEFDFEPKE